MNDTELVNAWSTLAPSARVRARMEPRVLEWVEAGETSLLREWLGLLKLEPLKGLAYATAGALSLLALTPVGWLTALFLA